MKRLDPFAIPLDGARLIEANAGTGKTYTITTLYLRLLLERQLDVGQILVVTYTNAATAELRRRVRERLSEMLAALDSECDAGDATIRELARRRREHGSVGADRQRLAGALYGFDEAAIFTIHGFCQRVLHEHAFESGVAFDTELIGDDRLLVDEVVRDFWMRELYAAPAQLLAGLGRLSPTVLAERLRTLIAHPDARLVPPRPDANLDTAIAAGDASKEALQLRCVQLQLDLADYARQELLRRKQANGTQSFDDLLQRLDTALHDDGGAQLAAKIRARFAAVLVDEFQDTDPTQARIFDCIYRQRPGALFMIGDPKQAIYAFRGADVFTYVRAKHRVGDDAYALDVNWRSSPSLVRAVNTLFGAARAPFMFSGIPFFPSQTRSGAEDQLGGALAGCAPLRFLFVPRDGRPLTPGPHGMIRKGDTEWFDAAIAGEITRLLNADTRIGDRRVGAGDIAVLSRTNRQSTKIQQALTTLGVPSVMYGDTSVFETPEADAVYRVIRALADPGNANAVAAALLTPIVGLTGSDLFELRGDDRGWEEWVDRFQSWSACWKSDGFTVAFRRVLDEHGVLGRILARRPGGERCITNVLHLGELLQQAAVDGRRGPLELVEWLQRMRYDERARIGEAAESAQIRLESDTNALKLITIHKSKGLEYPVVIAPFLWDGPAAKPGEREYIRCHTGDDDQLTIDLGSDQLGRHTELHKREMLAESLRLLYVALTRAQHLCIVPWGAFNFVEGAALGYLIHQPSGESVDLAEATRERIKRLTDAQMRADLDRIAVASQGAIEVVELSTAAAERFAVPPGIAQPLQLRQMSRAVLQPWRVASFSALAAGAPDPVLPAPLAEGVDHDEVADAPILPAAAEVALVRGFPRGKRLGNLVHKLFETIDFATCEPAALRDHAARLMPVFAIEAQWTDALCGAIGDVLDTPLLPGSALTLRKVPAARRLNELEFVFPVAIGGEHAFTAARLAEVLVTHGAPWLADYAARVQQLSFGQLAGYLRGFVDLVFEHEGRWFIVDYKTNDLGDRASDYRLPRMTSEMQRHHYALQYHLYAVALHRYLQRRLPGYDPAQHFGGALYLFVRGMAPQHPAGNGVFFDRPSPALLDALSDAMAGRADGLAAAGSR
jgi:exodeoxyribonuclease V beta subunit